MPRTRNAMRMESGGRFFIARHGETVFNAASRMQGERHLHTPLTRAGFAQADAMGAALQKYLRGEPSTDLKLWASDTGRALQTLAVIAEHIGADWHQASTDKRLREIDIGCWSGRTYAELVAEGGPVSDPATGLFLRNAPDGEWYDAIAARLQSWLDEMAEETGDRLIIMHGLSARVLRGLLLGLPVDPAHRAGIAGHLPQGSMAMIQDGAETIIHLGSRPAPA